MKIVTVSRNTKRSLLFLSLIAMIGTIAVYAAVNQTIPAETIPQTTVLPGCNAPATTTTITSGSGALQFECGTTAAFTTVAGTSTPSATSYPACPSATPCYVTFGYVPHGDTTSCTTSGNQPNFHAITTPNTATFLAQTFTGAGSWDYCGIYSAPPAGGTLPSFALGWS